MSQFPRRTAHTEWSNPEPFADIHAVLGLLNAESPTFEPNHLEHCFEDGFEWQIVVPWYTKGSSGGDHSGHDYFQIEPDLAKRMAEERLVEARRIPRMGYTETRERELVISGLGKETLQAFEEEMRAKAEGMLTPGIHTDLTGSPIYRGHSRDPWCYGALYYQFEMPSGEVCKAYPEEGRIDLPD